MRKSELIALVEEKEECLSGKDRYITLLQEEKRSLERECVTLQENNDKLAHDNGSMKNTLVSRDNTIARQREEIERADTSLRIYRDKCERMDRELYDTKHELDRVRSSNDTLLKLIEQLQPKENQNPVECEKGEWCNACVFNKSIKIYHNGQTIHKDICMKNCSCKEFAPVKESSDD